MATRALTARVFIPIHKIDVEKRLVYGRITDETPDATNEICDYATSAPLFKAWSEAAEAATTAAGQAVSKGNIRVMHGLKAAGRLDDLIFDDAEKAIDCVAKIVDDAEWEKCLEGVYTGFSLGGHYVGKKWKDAATGAMRYTVDPVEASLVDLPCNRSATFSALKAGGITEEIAFKSGGAGGGEDDAQAEAPNAAADGWMPDNPAVKARAGEMAAAAGVPARWANYVVQARTELIKAHEGAEPTPEVAAEEIPAVVEAAADPVVEAEAGAADPGADKTTLAGLMAMEQVWRTADGKTFPGKEQAAEHAASLVIAEKAKTNPLLAEIARAAAPTPAPAAENATFDREALKDAGAALTLLRSAYADNVVVKSLYSVSSLATIISNLGWLVSDVVWEREYEGDESKVPEDLLAHLAGLGECLLTLAREEIAELIESLNRQGVNVELIVADSDATIVEAANRAIDVVKASESLVQKAGARNSKTDLERIQTIHEAAKALGADCGKEAAAEADEVETLSVVKAERDALSQQMAEALPAVKAIADELIAVREEMVLLKATSAPPAPRLSIIDKTQDNGGPPAGAGAGAAMLAEILKTTDPLIVARAVIAHQQTQPGVMTPRTS